MYLWWLGPPRTSAPAKYALLGVDSPVPSALGLTIAKYEYHSAWSCPMPVSHLDWQVESSLTQ